jgi:hypothetical protein
MTESGANSSFKDSTYQTFRRVLAFYALPAPVRDGTKVLGLFRVELHVKKCSSTSSEEIVFI